MIFEMIFAKVNSKIISDVVIWTPIDYVVSVILVKKNHFGLK